MKLKIFAVLICFFVTLPNCYAKEPLTKKELILVRKIMRLSFLLEVSLCSDASVRLKARNVNEPYSLRMEPLQVALSNNKDSIENLKKIMEETDDQFVVFNAVRGLALLGNKEGLPILKGVASGENTHTISSSSGMEKSEAGLALLALNEEFPAGFLFSKQTIRLYSELDMFLE